MDKSKYTTRIIDDEVEEYLAAFGAVCVEGPKWCGKTWTSAYHANSEIMIGNPANDFQYRRLAVMSPAVVLEGATPRLIDEWQEVPPIWDAVRYEVDRRNLKGQFILTGSATPNHKGIMHSGAGRIGKIRMRPMTLYEAGRSSGKVSLKELCDGVLTPALTGEVDLNFLIDAIIRGGWPANQSAPLKRAALLPKSYIKAIIDDDVYRIDGVKRDVNKMRLLLRSLARNESTTASNKTLKNDIKEKDDEDINIDTVTAYLDIFNRLFLTDNQPPFSSSIRSSIRVKQSEKRHFADPSIACAVLNVTPEMLLGDLNALGFLFEALCERDLRVYAESFGARMYHYRDYNDNEIDAVIELDGGEWCAFEIKLGANKIDEGAESLVKIRERFKRDGNKPPKVCCVICGLTNAAYVRPDGVFVVPITALKN